MAKNKEVQIPSLEEIEEERKRLKYKLRYRRTLRSTIGVLIVVAAIATLVAVFWMPVLQIYGSSMAPTLEDGQIIVTVKGKDFKTGDLVAFYYGNKLLVKRVIAGPGDWVVVDQDGYVYVNDVLLDEPYISDRSLGECDQEFPMQVNEERWFVLGDNRSVSIDSRSSVVGCISMEQIAGKIVLRVWPLSEFGLFE